MKPGVSKKTIRLLMILALIYMAGGLALYLGQDLIIFHPTPLPAQHHFDFDQAYEEVNLAYGKDNINIVKFKAQTLRRGLVLFFHGNMYNVEHYKRYPALFTRNGLDVWMIDYPGFGKTTGKRSEKAIYSQADLMYNLARKEVPANSLVIYGKSIGTGIASWLASERACRQLILESPYYSMAAMSRHYFPLYPASLTRYSFPTYAYLKKIKVPVTIFHGDNDEVIPYSQGRKLALENSQVKLVTIENGSHNDLYYFALFQRTLDTILSGQPR